MPEREGNFILSTGYARSQVLLQARDTLSSSRLIRLWNRRCAVNRVVRWIGATDWPGSNVSSLMVSRPILLLGRVEWSRAASLAERSSSGPVAAEHSPDLYRRYVEPETFIGHSLSPLPQFTGVPAAPSSGRTVTIHRAAGDGRARMVVLQ